MPTWRCFLEHLLGWLGALGVPVIVLSATLPSERRAALARAWRGLEGPTDGVNAGEPIAVDDLETARERAYPLVTVTTRTGTTTCSTDEGRPFSTAACRTCPHCRG